jgi:hypothetical protein
VGSGEPSLLLYKMDFAGEAEYRQQIKTFRLKYIFLAVKIIRTARSGVMKLSEKYPYREIYEKSLPLKYHPSCLNPLFRLKLTRKNLSDDRICESGSPKMMLNLG